MTTDALDLLPISLLSPALVEATGDARWSQVRAELISGGKSNLTFTLSSAAGRADPASPTDRRAAPQRTRHGSGGADPGGPRGQRGADRRGSCWSTRATCWASPAT